MTIVAMTIEQFWKLKTDNDMTLTRKMLEEPTKKKIT